MSTSNSTATTLPWPQQSFSSSSSSSSPSSTPTKCYEHEHGYSSPSSSAASVRYPLPSSPYHLHLHFHLHLHLRHQLTKCVSASSRSHRLHRPGRSLERVPQLERRRILYPNHPPARRARAVRCEYLHDARANHPSHRRGSALAHTQEMAYQDICGGRCAFVFHAGRR